MKAFSRANTVRVVSDLLLLVIYQIMVPMAIHPKGTAKLG